MSMSLPRLDPALTYPSRVLCPSLRAYSLVGYCMSHLGRTSDAIRAYSCALRLNPADRCTRALLKDTKNPLEESESKGDSEVVSSDDPIFSAARVCGIKNSLY